METDTSFSYQINSFDTSFTGTQNLEEAMGAPIRIQNLNLSCDATQEFFQSNKTLDVTAIEDSWISRVNPGIIYGNDAQLIASGYVQGLSPDSATASIFLRFGLPNIVTNAEVSSSTLVLQADTNNTDLTAALRAFPVTESWLEQSITYSNRPNSDTTLVPPTFITPDDLLRTSSGTILPIYETDITQFAQSIKDIGFGLELVSFSSHFLASREVGSLVFPPTINLKLTNNADISISAPFIDVGFVEAGDTLEISFGDFFNQLIPNFELIDDSLETEDLLTFSLGNPCLNNLIISAPILDEVPQDRYFDFTPDTPTTIPIDTLTPVYQTNLEPKLVYENGDTTLPDIFLNYTMELYDVPEINNLPIAFFGTGTGDNEPPGSGIPTFTQRVFLDDFTLSSPLLARADSLTEDSTFKVRVYGYMVKGLTAGKLVNGISSVITDLNNLPPGFSENNEINDPNCGLPIDTIAENVFVNCFEFRITNLSPEVRIIEPEEDWSDQMISGIPEMPELNFDAEVINLVTNNPLEFLWEFNVEYSLNRFGVENGNRFEYCPRVGQCTFSGNSTDLNTNTTNWIVNFNQEFATCLAKNNERVLPINTLDCTSNDQTTDWGADEDIFIGGSVSLNVRVPVSSGDTLFASADSIFSILGQNPTPNNVRNGIEIPYQVILYHESLPRWAQFNTRNRNDYNGIGMPVYGFPNGYGIAQIDRPVASPQQLWNWNSNRERGLEIFQEKEAQARTYLNRLSNRQINPAPKFEIEPNSEELLLREQFQRYNGGRYWDWQLLNSRNPNQGGRWVPIAANAFNLDEPYGTILWELYQNVLNENLPQGWN